jgi:ATP-binding protein involved in chromosome partitioning
MPSPREILDTLRSVPYPGFTRDVVSFGIIKDIEVSSSGVTVVVAPTTDNVDVVREICAAVEGAVRAMQIGPVTVRVETSGRPPVQPRGPRPIPGVRSVIAVASGKGGVGKSTVATNLALALAGTLPRVGLMDADVYGPSIPLMLGITDRPKTDDTGRILPVTAHGLPVISMGLFLGERTPVIWRGPMVTKLLTEFLRNVEWGELDCLVIDLPPGTGDVQLTIVQQVLLSGGVIVTTPQDVALLDVQRGISMFQQVHAPVLGVIENMSYHVCPGCGARADLFGHGGGARMAAQFGIPFLGEVPLLRAVRAAADDGRPFLVAEPEHPVSRVFRDIAARVLTRLRETGPAQLGSAGGPDGSVPTKE